MCMLWHNRRSMTENYNCLTGVHSIWRLLVCTHQYNPTLQDIHPLGNTPSVKYEITWQSHDPQTGSSCIPCWHQHQCGCHLCMCIQMCPWECRQGNEDPNPYKHHKVIRNNKFHKDTHTDTQTDTNCVHHINGKIVWLMNECALTELEMVSQRSMVKKYFRANNCPISTYWYLVITLL